MTHSLKLSRSTGVGITDLQVLIVIVFYPVIFVVWFDVFMN